MDLCKKREKKKVTSTIFNFSHYDNEQLKIFCQAIPMAYPKELKEKMCDNVHMKALNAFALSKFKAMYYIFYLIPWFIYAISTMVYFTFFMTEYTIEMCREDTVIMVVINI